MTNGIVVTAYRTMTQIATESIKELIIKGSYKPGSRLIPAKLEEEFKLGRAAIREALRDLQGQGLVISVPNKGVVVAPAIDPQEVQEVFEIRYELEGRASELAAASITDPEIDKLERLNADLVGYSQATHEYFLLNRKFHMDFYQASKRTFLCQIIGQIYDRVLVWRTINLVRSADIPRFVDAHKELLQAARLHDGKKARQIMVEHLRSGYESFVDWMKDREKNP
jgi:DNA-binding GntR family transcriptional regulator